MQKLFKHQIPLASDYKGSRLLVWEGGAGKTIGACVWLRDGRDEDALVICPKKVVRKWQNTLKEWGTKATVISKEEFKKTEHKEWSAIVLDEADEFASPLFIAKSRSQLTTHFYELIRKYPNIQTLLCTATPIRSNPWNLHTLLAFIGHYINHQDWRKEFFTLTFLPYLPRPAYIPKPDWRQRIRPVLEKYADIVLLKDIAELPPVTERKIDVSTPKFIESLEDKPFFTEHRWEQLNKPKYILEIGKEYRKVLVVAYYREQIEELQLILGKNRATFAIHGGIKDQEEIIRQAQESDECFFIVQASIGAGFDADSFSCVVFASMSYAVRDFVQMKFRVRRIHNLHSVCYNYLIGGRCDKAVLGNIELGKDFVPATWNATPTPQKTSKKGSQFRTDFQTHDRKNSSEGILPL